MILSNVDNRAENNAFCYINLILMKFKTLKHVNI
jgi:hypothetical protein